MKKQLFTVVLAFVLMMAMFAVTASAVDTQAVRIETGAATGVDLSELCEGDTFDVYITVPLTQGANANQLYYRGYDLGSATANRTFNSGNAKLTEEALTLTWTNTDIYVSSISYIDDPDAGKNYANTPKLTSAGTVGGTELFFVFPGNNVSAAVGKASETAYGVSAGVSELTISYDGAFNAYILNQTNKTNKPTTQPTTGVIAKVTFTVAKESGAEETIKLTNSHKISGTAESYDAPTCTVTLKAGCVHPAENRNYEAQEAVEKNVAPTCYALGERWFYCSNCQKLVKEDVEKTAHNFTNYTVESDATCWATGVAKYYCANDGCTEYDHTQGNDGVITLEKLTHEASAELTDTATCTEDGYAFYTCTKCGGLSADGHTFFNISYNAETKTFKNNVTGQAYTPPEAFKSYAKGHDYVQDTENPNKYVCSRCGDEIIVDASSRVRYVSQDGTGNGLTADTPTSLRAAFDDLGKLPAAVDATIYLVGEKIAFTDVSAVSDTCSSCFEESKHANHITITSANTNNKTIIEFNDVVKYYYLYGPTTFENVKFGSTVIGTAKSAGDATDSGGFSICARGFKLVMGLGLEMLSSGDGMHVTKTDGGLDNIDIIIPDAKVYLAGGFYASQIYPGADTQSVQTDVTVLSGEYWNIEGLNRGGSTSYAGAHAKITIGGGTFASIVPITAMSGASFAGDDNIIDIHYIPGGTYICANDYRSCINAMTGKITVNRLFHSGADMQVGDFLMGSKTITNNERIVNCFWDEGLEEEKHVKKFIAKGVANAATYAETNTNDTFVVYCIDFLGGHDYDDNDVCTFCGIKACAEHTWQQVVVTPSTCSAGGVAYDQCTVCYEKSEEYALSAGGIHDMHYTVADGKVTGECAFCHNKVEWNLSDYTNRTIYVKDPAELKEPGDVLTAKGTGISKTSPIYDFAVAMQIAAAMDGDAKVCLTGKKISLTEASFVSPNCTSCFEEPQHANHITITSADRSNKTTLEFTPAAKFYHLYGPTTFEYINIGATIVGTSSSGGIAILGRGFPLVMGEGLTMLSQGTPITVTKDYLDNVSLSIPDVKVYIAGGFLDNQIYPGADSQSVETDLTIKSGTYWCIEGLNRGNAKTFEGAHGKVTIAGGETYYLIPTTASPSAVFNGDDNVVDIHYVSGNTYVCPLDYRVSNQAMTGKITVNRFFHSGAKMLVGDFMMGSATTTNNERFVNCYWDKNMEAEKHVLHFLKKGNDNAATYAETNKSGAMPAYCIDNFGAHDYVDDICTRCGVTKCKEHTYFAETEIAPTCVSTGDVAWRCENCYEYSYETLPIDPDAHDYHFDISNPDLYKCVCSYCGNVYCTVNPKTAMKNNTLYVSDKGVPYGGFTPALPLNDYDMAMKIAAACGADDVTICIVGTVSVGANTSYSVGAAYLEPEHSGTHITVCGYDANPKDDVVTLGVLSFGYNGGYRSVYGLNGDTTFDAVEFSSGEEKGNIYIVGRHNHLVFGEHMTSDYLRSANGGDYHGGNVLAIGGCYAGVFGDCANTSSHLEIHSGTYRAIYGGSVSQTCGMNTTGSSVELELLGDITVREIIVFGSRSAVPKEGDAGKLETVNVTIDGNVQAGAQICFGSYDNAPKVGNVTISYRSGFFSAYAFGSTLEASAANMKTFTNRILGSSTTDNDFNNQIDSIDFYYNSSDKTVASVVKSLEARIKTNGTKKSPAGGFNFYNVSMECLGGGSHTPGDVIETKASTCAEAGYTTYRCTTCGKTYTVVLEKLAHTMTAFVKVSDANCISPEIQKSYCTVCGYAKYKTVGKIAADNHNFVDGICTHCGYDRTVGCDHIWNDGVIENSGCTSCKVYTCQTCGCRRTEDVVGTHNYGKFTVTVEPTATTPGLKTRVCKDCGKVDTAILYATDGALNSEGVAVDENGKTTDIDTAKLSKSQKAVVNAFLSQAAIGTEVKYAFKVNANGTATFSIPLPEKYADLKNVKVIVKDDDGKLTEVAYTIDRGYIVFTY
ncbi:MAG: hypothetical protein IJS44_04700 [Clostridia bacterium]|nr:hypothetical protein [Clostridia bacterium]